MKLFSILIPLLLSVPCTVFAQGIKIDPEIKRDGTSFNVVYTADNTFKERRTILFDLNGSTYKNADRSFPVITTLFPGKSRLVTISGSRITANVNLVDVPGCLGTNPKEVTYLLPIAPGKSTKIDTLSNIEEQYLGRQAPKNWLAYGMSAEPGDTIFASRRGRVIQVETLEGSGANSALSYSVFKTYVTIEHADCTRGQYELFDPASIMVTVGDEVEAGTPLGRVIDGRAYSSGTHLRFFVYYSEITRELMRDRREDLSVPIQNVYVSPNFAAIGKPEVGQTYTSVHPEKVIFQEMSKRQIKRYKKAKIDR